MFILHYSSSTDPPEIGNWRQKAKNPAIFVLTATWNGRLDRHGKLCGVDPYGYRKQAVLTVLRWVQTWAEWGNVFQHLTPFGDETEEDTRSHVKRFLNLGVDMSDELDRIEARLKFSPARGYAVIMNDSFEYGMYTTDNRAFAMAERLEPLNGNGSGSDTGLA